jgi:2,4-dienoyl-CoA reductase-like NADH-dependent reductase (Old Yellow Enzyme family)
MLARYRDRKATGSSGSGLYNLRPLSTVKHSIPEARWPSAEEASKSRVFSPGSLGEVRTESRTWVPAMVPWRCTEEGFVTPEVLDWYGRLADGRPGVLVVEATGIRDVPSGPLMRAGHDRFIPGLRELVELVRARSGGETRLIIQLIDFLTIRRRPGEQQWIRRFLKLEPRHHEAARALGHEPADDDTLRELLLSLDHETLLSLLNEREREDLQMGYRERVNDLQLPHIQELPAVLPGLFADAAARAEAAGFDGVELHYAHAYTMASFLSSKNDRDDGYGGSPKARARLPLEVFRAVRERVGTSLAVGCRFLGDEVIEDGGRIEDACYYGVAFAEAGMDFLSVSKGGKFEDAKQPKVGAASYPYTGESGHECMPTVRIEGDAPFGRNLSLPRAIRDAVRGAGHETPVVAAGGLNDFDIMEGALSAGACDFVAAARQSLADPDWWAKLRAGRGKEVNRCLYTNYCEALDQRHLQVTCQLWDRDLRAAGSSELLSPDGKRRLSAPPWKP